MEKNFNSNEKENLTEHGLVFSHERKTSVKTRVISEGKHQLRIDEKIDTYVKLKIYF